MSTEFQYPDVLATDRIRLINLFPCSSEYDLRCTLETVTFGRESSFEAISYVWGNETSGHVLEILLADGSLSYLNITDNLVIALMQARKEAEPRLLWVDRVCINQENMQERNAQVTIMAKIYRQAQRVLISLGQDDGVASAAVECMKAYLRAETKFEELRLTTAEPSWVPLSDRHTTLFGMKKNIALGEKFGIPDLSSPQFQALQTVFRYPWFDRAWTWQESHLAIEKVFHCGRQRWTGDVMQKVTQVLRRLEVVSGDDRYFRHMEISKAMPMLLSKDSLPENLKFATEFLTTLAVRRGSGCKFPSDLVYSLLGATTRCPEIDVDYNVHFTTVFIKVAMGLIDEYGDLRIFSFIDGPRTESLLPSWVPDWRERNNRSGITSWMDPTHFSYNLSTKPRVRLLPDNKTLEVGGYYLDKIVATQPPHMSDEDFLGDLYEKRYRPTAEPMLVALVRSQCRDYNIFEPDRPRARWDPDAWGRVEAINAASEAGPTGQRRYAALLTAITQATMNVVLFKTAKAFIGYGCSLAREGDTIVRLFGAQSPMILRQVKDKDHFRLVGESYLHGFMDEEILTGDVSNKGSDIRLV